MAPSPSDVRTELERILAFPDFLNSRRNSSFLRFVVEEALAGRGERLKAYTIAIRLLGRHEGFDPSADSLVRTQAGRVRRSLERYYLTEGASDRLRIQIPVGTYRPVFSTMGHEGPDASPSQENYDGFLAEPTLMVDYLVNLTPESLPDLQVRGLSQELATALARFEALRVVPPPVREDQRDAQGETRESSAHPTADLRLSGTVACPEDTLRVSLVLQDCATGKVQWSAPFYRHFTADTAFAAQADIAREAACLLADLAGAIPRSLLLKYAGTRSGDLPFYPAVFRYLNTPTRTPTQFTALHGSLTKMLERAPHHAFAHAMMAEACIHDYNYMFGLVETPLDTALSFARHAVDLDAGSQLSEMVLAYAYVQRRELEQFFFHARRCVELNTDACLPIGHIGVCLVLCGEWDEGLSLVRQAMELNPNYYRYFHHAPFLDHFRRGEYRAALAEARLFNTPGFFWAPLLRAAALGMLSNVDEGRQAVAELLDLRPDFRERGGLLIERFVHNEEIEAHLLEGLAAAGLNVID